MNKKAVLIIALVALVVSIAGATIAYNLLVGFGSGGSGTVGDTPGALITGTPAPDTSVANRQAAPNITFVDEQGNTVKLTDFRGTPVVLNFWASWCPPCKSEMPDFDSAYQEYGSQVQFIMLNVTDGQRETIDTATQYLTEQGFSFPGYFDSQGDGVFAYTITSIPETVFIDRNGNIASTQIGAISNSALHDGISLILE